MYVGIAECVAEIVVRICDYSICSTVAWFIALVL